MVKIPLLTALDAALPEAATSAASKEVARYGQALSVRFDVVRDTRLFTNKQILRIQLERAQNKAGFRTQPGTALMTASVTIHNVPLYGILSGAR